MPTATLRGETTNASLDASHWTSDLLQEHCIDVYDVRPFLCDRPNLQIGSPLDKVEGLQLIMSVSWMDRHPPTNELVLTELPHWSTIQSPGKTRGCGPPCRCESEMQAKALVKHGWHGHMTVRGLETLVGTNALD
jgi:hypothetical protein